MSTWVRLDVIGCEGVSEVRKGDRFKWGDYHLVEVIQVARDGSWADILVVPPTAPSWRKRQPLPLPKSFVRWSA